MDNAGSLLCFRSPLGPIGLAASDGGLLCIHLPDDPHDGPSAIEETLPRAASLLAPELSFEWTRSPVGCLADACVALDEFFAGRRRRFDLPLDLRRSGFTREVLEALINIPYGCITTYGELARRVGSPRAARAVGAACRRNPLPIVIPCHRVIGSEGTLVGFAGGTRALWLKNALLELERGEPLEATMSIG